jgi:hypothetical protein
MNVDKLKYRECPQPLNHIPSECALFAHKLRLNFRS